MKILILDDYQDVVRHLDCFARLGGHEARVLTATAAGLGQLAVRLRDAEALVLTRERTRINEALLARLPKLRIISQTGKVGPHIDVEACSRRGVAVAEGTGYSAATSSNTLWKRPSVIFMMLSLVKAVTFLRPCTRAYSKA